MAYENLKSAIKQAIKQNGNQEITGNLLQSTLLNIVNTLGADYKFLGFASPSTVPPTSEEGKLFYFASKAGEYINFPTTDKNTHVVTEEGLYLLTKEANSDYWKANTLIEIAQDFGASTDKVLSQRKVSDEISKAFAFAGLTANNLTDYIFAKSGSTESSKIVSITQSKGYYNSLGQICSSDSYVCAVVPIDTAYKYVKIKFAVGNPEFEYQLPPTYGYKAKAFFSYDGSPISYIYNLDGSKFKEFIIPRGATHIYISSRSKKDQYLIHEQGTIEVVFYNTAEPRLANNSDLIKLQTKLDDKLDDNLQVKFYNGIGVTTGNVSALKMADNELNIIDNTYYNIDGSVGNSDNYVCAKVYVKPYRNVWLLIKGCLFGSAYAAKSFFMLEDGSVKFISNEGYIEKYILVPHNATYMYISSRKYNNFYKTYNIDFKGVSEISVYYNVGTPPSFVDMRAYVSLDSRLTSLENTKCEIYKKSNKMFHFSLDDFKDSIADIVNNKYMYNSIFDNATFKQLKEWHDKYGIVISLYVQRTLADIPSKFALDFINSKDWLKFGFHGNGTTWESATYDMGKSMWNDFVDGIMSSIGSYDIIDRVPRNDYFHGTLDSCKGERDANCGCLGFLGCDDWGYNAAVRKNNYYLSSEESVFLDSRDRFIDYANQLTIFKTDFRLEQVATRWTDVDKCLEYYKSAQAASQAFDLIVFSHEWNFTSYKSVAEKIFSWAKNNGYSFDYPMNKILG